MELCKHAMHAVALEAGVAADAGAAGVAGGEAEARLKKERVLLEKTVQFAFRYLFGLGVCDFYFISCGGALVSSRRW